MHRTPSDSPALSAAVTLSAGPVSATVLGGELLSVSSLRYREVELLADPRDLPSGYRVHDARAGITLLHPWANRLGSDAFGFRGTESRLDGDASRLTRDANGLAIHGLTAPCPWAPVLDGTGAAVAALTWPAEPGFAFSHAITVRLKLSTEPDGSATLSIRTEVSARDGDSVPVAFGWHPYFLRDAGSSIELPALTELSADALGLPSGPRTPVKPSRIELGDRTLDDGVADLASGAQMRLHNRAHTIAVAFGPGYPFGQVFAPTDAPVVSFEPMTAPTDALRRGSEFPVAGPDTPFSATFAVRISATPSPD